MENFIDWLQYDPLYKVIFMIKNKNKSADSTHIYILTKLIIIFNLNLMIIYYF